MTRFFSFAGMQRSGNHAVIYWFAGHFNSYFYRNNILGVRYDGKPSQDSRVGAAEYEACIDSWENYDPATLEVRKDSLPVIAILRDPYNWWASWFQFPIPNPNVTSVNRPDTIDWYIKYIEYAKSTGRFILFNKWLEYDYRRELEQKYDLENSDKNLNEISGMCCGSSFNGYGYQNRATEMKLLERWKQCCNHPAYYKPLEKRPELADIARELFDMEPIL